MNVDVATPDSSQEINLSIKLNAIYFYQNCIIFAVFFYNETVAHGFEINYMNKPICWMSVFPSHFMFVFIENSFIENGRLKSTKEEN